MTPLRITAELQGPISLRDGALRLDGILAWAVAQLTGLPPPGFGPLQAIEIPIAKEPGGRFHLCSFAVPAFDQSEVRHVNRKFPIGEAQAFGEPKFRRIDISAGPQKSYRIPTVASHVEHDRLEWFAVGDEERVRGLLSIVTHLGYRRAVGRGKVARWTVEACEPWDDGFPIARDGKPLRALPPDWPGLQDPALVFGNISFPYWDKTAEQLCAVPEIPA